MVIMKTSVEPIIRDLLLKIFHTKIIKGSYERRRQRNLLENTDLFMMVVDGSDLQVEGRRGITRERERERY